MNSPVRAFKSVGGTPRFIARAAGSRIWDVDGNEYIDYVGSWGPMILGHTHPDVVAGVCETAANGMSVGFLWEADEDAHCPQSAEHTSPASGGVEYF